MTTMLEAPEASTHGYPLEVTHQPGFVQINLAGVELVIRESATEPGLMLVSVTTAAGDANPDQQVHIEVDGDGVFGPKVIPAVNISVIPEAAWG